MTQLQAFQIIEQLGNEAVRRGLLGSITDAIKVAEALELLKPQTAGSNGKRLQEHDGDGVAAGHKK